MTTNAIQISAQYLQAGDFERAEETVRQLLRENSAHAQGWCLLGVIRQMRGRPDEALPLFQESARLDPSNADVFNFAGSALVQLRQPTQAQTCLEEALRLNPFHGQAYSNLGKVHLLNQRTDDAIVCFREAVRLQSNNVDALHSLALLLIDRRQFDEALPLLERVVELAPGFSGSLVSLAMLHFVKGEFEPALEAAEKAVELDPRQFAAQDLLGAILLKMGRREEAVAPLQAALRAAPDYAPALEHLGVALLSLNRVSEAEGLLRKALQLNPASTHTRSDLAAVLVVQQRWDEVIALVSPVVQQSRDAPDLLEHLGLAYRNLATALVGQRRWEEVIALISPAVQQQPDAPDLLEHLGLAYRHLKRSQEAIPVLEQALRLRPSPDALVSLGWAYIDAAQPEEARARFEQALQMQPYDAHTLAGLATAYKDLALQDEAIACYRRSLALTPNQPETHSALIFNLHYSPNTTPEEIFHEHREWARLHAVPPVTPAPHANDRDPERRLRIGYVSADFFANVAANYIELMLRAHDRRCVEVFCYGNVSRPDIVTQRLQGLTDHWRNIFCVTDEQVEQMIRQDGIDVLVDLSGHVGGSRLTLLARKAAPVQVSHFGYMNTTGLPAMDYRITSAYFDTPGQTERYYTERLVRLPETLWCYRPEIVVEVNDLPAASAGHVALGMFNNFPKVTPEALAAWARIMQRLPGSRLVVVANPGAPERRLRDALAGHGIDPGRLTLLGRQGGADYFRLYHRVDIMLDPFPYTGLYTTADSLWMGVPVVTRQGPTYVTRQAASLLTQVGLDDLIAATTDEYVETVVRLAEDVPRLQQLRAALRERLSLSPLMNPERFTRRLEEAYRWMWRQWCQASGG